MLTQKQIEAKMMLHTGSQRSYISQKGTTSFELENNQNRRDIYR